MDAMIRILAAAALATLAASAAVAQTYVPGRVGPNGVFVPGHVEHASDPVAQPSAPTDGYASAYQAAGPQPRTATTDDTDSLSAYAPVSPRSGANTQDLGDRYRMGPGADPVAASTRNTRGYRDGT
jgi:hypothetical protein